MSILVSSSSISIENVVIKAPHRRPIREYILPERASQVIGHPMPLRVVEDEALDVAKLGRSLQRWSIPLVRQERP